MAFWVISLGLAAFCAATLARALWRGHAGDETAFDMQIYRDQLSEVDRDLARGVVTEAEAETIRTEVSRRILDADRAARDGGDPDAAPTAATRILAAALVLGVAGGAAALYWRIGAPGYPDLPLETRIAMAEEARLARIGQGDAEALAGVPAGTTDTDPAYLDLVEQLRTAVAERPDDLQGHRLLARQEAALGNFAAAHAAQARVIAILGDAATAPDHAEHADLLILAAGGYVSPEAEAALRETLSRDPRNGIARYYSGLLAAQTGRPDVAFHLWRALLEEGPADAPWIPPIRADIAALASLAGVRYEPPAAPRGPNAADVEAAADMSPADRMEMIRGMVSGLSDRLATEGGPPEDWAQLIRAHGVLGETDQAMAIWQEARGIFPEDVVETQIRPAARDAGVAE